MIQKIETTNSVGINSSVENSQHIVIWKLESSEALGLGKTAWLAEAIRRALMSRVGHIAGFDNVPEILSGHSEEGVLRKSHASFLPLDLDFDGKLDHVALHLPTPPTDQLRMSIFSLRNVHLYGQSALLIPLYLGAQRTSPVLCIESSKYWISVSPWAHPWHLKKNFGLEQQFREELRRDGLPTPLTVEFAEECFSRGAECNVRQFPYRRPGKELVRHSVQLKFVKISFETDVEGPLLLGRTRHFGYGLFLPSAS